MPINADTTNVTVVNNPKIFCARTTVECIVISSGSACVKGCGRGKQASSVLAIL
jgi:hypothetical protein